MLKYEMKCDGDFPHSDGSSRPPHSAMSALNSKSTASCEGRPHYPTLIFREPWVNVRTRKRWQVVGGRYPSPLSFMMPWH